MIIKILLLGGSIMDKESLGDAIKRCRKEAKLSLREAAKQTNISHPYLSQLENGKNKKPSLEILLKLSEGLNVPFAYLAFLANLESFQAVLDTEDELKINMLRYTDLSSLENLGDFESFSQKVKSEEQFSTHSIDETKNLYETLLELAQIEKKAKLATRLNIYDNQDLKENLAIKRNFAEHSAVSKFNDDMPTAIFLTEDNEGNFYFIKENETIPEETQIKIKKMIKMMLD